MGTLTFFRLGVFLSVPFTALIFFDMTLRYSETVGSKCLQQDDVQPVEPAIVIRQPPQVEFDVSNYTKGPPTSSLLENLRDDTKYITSFSNSGFSNDVMAYLNLIYLAMATQRVAIIPPLVPSQHIPIENSKIRLGEAFDLPRLARQIRHPVIEWSDLKTGNDHSDFLGCWSPWMTASSEKEPRGTYLYDVVGADIAWTGTPESTNFEQQPFSRMWPLAKLGFAEGRSKALNHHAETRNAPKRQEYTAPSEHLLCYDHLYFVGVDEHWEWEQDYAPVWRLIGQHLRFTQEVVDLAERFLRATFGLQQDEPIPPFVATHSRRGDFVRSLCDGRTKEDCVRPLPDWREDVERLRKSLLDERGLDISRVVMVSDETDTSFWAEVKEYGWQRVDYTSLADTGKPEDWYKIFIDLCILSMATGFVGTKGSTFSMLSHFRVRDWNNGLAISVPWKTF